MILKILGILILSILGLGLCIGLLVLFCPIRYRLAGSIYGKPEGSIRISWLFRLVYITFSYQEEKGKIKLRIFGITIRRRNRKAFSLKKWIKKKQREKEKEKPIKTFEYAEKAEQQAGIGREHKENRTEKEISVREKEKKEALTKEKEALAKEKEKKEASTKEKEEKGISAKEKKELLAKEKTEILQKTEKEKAGEEKEKKLEKKVSEKDNFLSDEVLKSSEKVKWWQLPAHICLKIKNSILSIKAAFYKILAFLKELQQKKRSIVEFIMDKGNQTAFRYTGGRFLKLLYHILPGKTKIKLHYGFADPATTGMITGMIFMLYPESAEKFELTPDFEKQVLEGELDMKGKVQIYRICWTLISIYHHKECKRIIKMILKR